MTKFKWTVEIEVDALWVADGFDLTEYAELSDGGPDTLIAMGEAAKWFTHEEATVKIISAPDATSIRKEQGYEEGET